MDTWNVTDFRVVPNIVTGGIGFYEAGNDGNQQPVPGEGDDHPAQPPDPLRLPVRGHQLRQHQPAHGPDVHRAERPGQTATGADSILPEITGLGQIYRVSARNFVAAHQTRQHYGDFFVQDTFTLGDRLTIRPGVRYEQQTLVGQLISASGTTDNDFTLSGNWAPRIGATYDVLGNGRSKIFANWGRFYAKIPNDLAARALSADAGISRADYYDAGLTQPIPEGTLTITQTPGSDRQVDDEPLPAAGRRRGPDRPECEVVV